MANVIMKTPGISEKELFRMMQGKNEGLKKVVGDIFDVVECAEIEKPDKDGELIRVIFLVLEDGRTVGSNSTTVRNTFESMVEVFGLPSPEKPWTGVTVVSTENKSGSRTYLDLDFAEEN